MPGTHEPDPPFDPSANVIALNEAATKRQDDLGALRDLRQDDLRVADRRLNNVKHGYTERMAELRAGYEEKLRVKESERLDAIRAVDVAAATLREERASASASLLANQVAITASTLRDLVASTAAAAATAAAAVTNPIADRVAQLERSSYEGAGKSGVVDPMMARMVEAVEQLRDTSSKGKGREGLSQPLLMVLVAAAASVGTYLIQVAMH